MTARLHTCYSPVRRSPAVGGKPPTPLPLDLHVLSLSLAFILSQDQTLRCFLSFFPLFLKLLCWHSPISNDRTASPARLPRPGIRQYHLLVFQELTKELFRLTAMKTDRTLALVLLYFVYCKLFNVLFSGSLPRSFGEERKTMQS